MNTDVLMKACVATATAMRNREDDLNAADARLGDGDTGQTMRRVADAMAETAEAQKGDDLGTSLRELALAAAATTGSSLGTLVSIGLLEMGKQMKGETHISAAKLAQAMAAAELAMLSRGRSSLGDKTAMDLLHAVRLAIHDSGEPRAVRAAASAALETFRDRPCLIGRAGRLSERSIGLDDPGMLAFYHVVDALCSMVEDRAV